jgi:hypothetical protein
MQLSDEAADPATTSVLSPDKIATALAVLLNNRVRMSDPV